MKKESNSVYIEIELPPLSRRKFLGMIAGAAFAYSGANMIDAGRLRQTAKPVNRVESRLATPTPADIVKKEAANSNFKVRLTRVGHGLVSLLMAVGITYYIASEPKDIDLDVGDVEKKVKPPKYSPWKKYYAEFPINERPCTPADFLVMKDHVISESASKH